MKMAPDAPKKYHARLTNVARDAKKRQDAQAKVALPLNRLQRIEGLRAKTSSRVGGTRRQPLNLIKSKLI